MDDVLNGKNILLGVSGGIAAYKSLELLRLFTKAGARVRVIMTRNARWFVGPASFEALSGRAVCTDLFEKKDDAGIRHIEWAQEANLAVVAPATANVIGKIANGLADDALTTFILAVTCPVMICPSMNTHMFENRAVQRNIDRLKEIGYLVVTPTAGALACGTVGPGRLPEPESILENAVYHLSPKDFAGKRVLVTAGPTWEPIDPVRFITNPSTGKMGFAVARAAAGRGADVLLISGPSALEDPLKVRVLRVQTAEEMAAAVIEHFPGSDIVVKTAAVSDYTPIERIPQKIKKTKGIMELHLRPTMDILREIGARKTNQVLIGFAAETENLRENAQKKLAEKNLDLIVGNPIGAADSGFAADTNTATLFYRDGTVEPLSAMKKSALAHLLLDRVLKCI